MSTIKKVFSTYQSIKNLGMSSQPGDQFHAITKIFEDTVSIRLWVRVGLVSLLEYWFRSTDSPKLTLNKIDVQMSLYKQEFCTAFKARKTPSYFTDLLKLTMNEFVVKMCLYKHTSSASKLHSRQEQIQVILGVKRLL